MSSGNILEKSGNILEKLGVMKKVCKLVTKNVTRFGKIRINAAINYFCFFLLTGYTGPEDLDFQV